MFQHLKDIFWTKPFDIDKKELVNVEKALILPLSIGGIVTSFISLLVNLFLNLGRELMVITLISVIIYSLIFFLARKGLYLGYIKWIFIISVFVFVNLIWSYNFGSHSPWLFLLVLLYSYLVFMLSGWQLLLVSVIYVVNTLILFWFEYNHYDLLGNYPDEQSRIIDYFIVVLMAGSLAFILMSLAKHFFISALAKAKEAEKLKSSFLANLSHEIRTPLNAIVGFSDLLIHSSCEDEDREGYTAVVNQSSNTLLRLIDDVLDVSMIETGQVNIEETHFVVNEMMENLYDTYFKLVEQRGRKLIKVEKDFPKNIYRIRSDRDRITQVLSNLLENAIKYTETGTIRLGFYKRKKFLHFYVADTGIGIKEEYQKSIFDRFYKIESGNRKLYRGVGLGLYLSKKIVELLGGTIWLESEYGKGSKFQFKIPAHDLEVKQR